MRVIPVTASTQLSDDFVYALKPASNIPVGTLLESLPEYVGSEEVFCEYDFPDIGPVRIPGLNSTIFGIQHANAWNGACEQLGIQMVKLPQMHTLCERALKKALGPYPYDYDYRRLASSIRAEAAHMTSNLIIRKALRNKEGTGWMALSQANPRLPMNVGQISLQLANEMIPILKRSHPDFFQVPSDLNGLKLSIVIRFPATTSKGVRVDMRLVIGGPGRAIYLNPFILKYGFVGDVDGDLFFAAIDKALKRLPINPNYDFSVPRTVTAENMKSDINLSTITAAPKADQFEVYKGLVAKEGIGEITNACYRATEIARIAFQDEEVKRSWFLDQCNREDIEQDFPNARIDPIQFRAVASRIIMDEFTPFYESVFDMRKDMSLFPYINHFLTALRRPNDTKMDFQYLRTMQYNGEPINLKALPIIWDICNGRLSEYLNQYPIIQLQFDGKGNTDQRKNHLSKIMDYYAEEGGVFGKILEREFAGETSTKLVLD